MKELENEKLLLLNEVRNYLSDKYGVLTYVTAEDRLAYAVKIAYTSFFVEDKPFATSKEFVNRVLKEYPQKSTYAGIERSIYRTLEKYSIDMNISDGIDLRRDCVKLAKEFKDQKVIA